MRLADVLRRESTNRVEGFHMRGMLSDTEPEEDLDYCDAGGVYRLTEYRTYYECVRKEIEGAVRMGRADEHERLRQSVLETERLGGLLDREAADLLEMVEILGTKDHETCLSLIYKHFPHLLTLASLRQAELNHEFRRENRCANTCAHLRWDTRERCARCIKPREAEADFWCTEECPARGSVLLEIGQNTVENPCNDEVGCVS